MSTTLNDLRERLKEAFEEFVEYRSRHILTTDPPRPRTNMLQSYRYSKRLLEWRTINANSAGIRLTSEYTVILRKFVAAGDIYYHAKKHGVKSAMLLKLAL